MLDYSSLMEKLLDTRSSNWVKLRTNLELVVTSSKRLIRMMTGFCSHLELHRFKVRDAKECGQ